MKPENDEKLTKTQIENVSHHDKSINQTTMQQQEKHPVIEKTKEEKFLYKGNSTPSIDAKHCTVNGS